MKISIDVSFALIYGMPDPVSMDIYSHSNRKLKDYYGLFDSVFVHVGLSRRASLLLPGEPYLYFSIQRPVHLSYTAAPYQPPMLGCVNLSLGCILVESSSRQHLYELMDFNQLPRRKEPFPPWNRPTRRKRCRKNTCLSTFAE